MVTFFCSILFLIIIGSLLRGIYLDNLEDGAFIPPMILSIIIIIVVFIALIIDINTPSKKTSKILVTPTISIKQEIEKDIVVKSDTTYTYIFKE